MLGTAVIFRVSPLSAFVTYGVREKPASFSSLPKTKIMQNMEMSNTVLVMAWHKTVEITFQDGIY